MNQTTSQGFVSCSSCYFPIHKLCTEESSKKKCFSIGVFRCKKCEEAKLKYVIEEEQGGLEDKGFSAEISEDNFVHGVRTRK